MRDKIFRLTGAFIVILTMWLISCQGPSQPMYDKNHPDPNPINKHLLQPKITLLVPIEGIPTRDTVRIYGEGFSPDSASNLIAFGNIPVPPISVSDTLLMVMTPKGKRHATVDVKVAVKGCVFWSCPAKFTYK